jgi:iron complex transport system substrate-binding protein
MTIFGAMSYRALALAVAVLSPVAVAQSIELTDPVGQSVTLPAPAQRVVAFPMPATSGVLATSHRSDSLAGAHRQALAALERSPLRHRYPDALTTSTAMVGDGFRPNVEELLRVAPDLVLQWGDRGAGLIEPIARLGLPVIGLRYGTDADAREGIRALGRAMGQEERAAIMLDWRARIEARMSEVRETFGDTPRPRVLYLPRIVNGFQAGGADNYINEALARAGGTNVAGHLPGNPILGPEQILELDPEVILIGSFDPGASVTRLLSDPRLAPARAVAERRIHKVPIGGYRWDPPSQESPLFWLWLGHRLHPGAAWPDLADTVQQGLRLLYDVRIDRETASAIAAGEWR